MALLFMVGQMYEVEAIKECPESRKTECQRKGYQCYGQTLTLILSKRRRNGKTSTSLICHHKDGRILLTDEDLKLEKRYKIKGFRKNPMHPSPRVRFNAGRDRQRDAMPRPVWAVGGVPLPPLEEPREFTTFGEQNS